MSFRLLIDGLHDRLLVQGWTDVRQSYGFVLLALRDAPTGITELAGLLGVSKQATSKLLDAMEQSGYVRRSSASADGRSKLVELADRGGGLLIAVEAIYAEVESEWAAIIGPRAVDQLRNHLTAVLLASHDGTMPPVRPLADPSRPHGLTR